MGLGSTAKKIQLVADTAEKMYKQVQELQGRITSLEGAVDETNETVDRLDAELAEQRALLVALAEEQGLDADAILEDAAVDDETASEADARSEA